MSDNPNDQTGFFKDSRGRIVVWQSPNIFLYGWILFTAVAFIISDKEYKSGFVQLSSSFLFAWAFLEVTKGVNYFRRLLGLIVLVVTIFGFFN